jgi:peptidoglycan LD-endopeptidase CwlK
MSLLLFKNDILFLQRILAVSGFYAGPLDGKWSAAVATAEIALDKASDDLMTHMGQFDKRSERIIETLIPKAQNLARQFMKTAQGFGHTVKLISGTRTYAEQDGLFAIGRTVQLNRKPVTKAKGGQSNHNFSIAWDVGLFDAAGRYLDGSKKGDDKAYSDLAKIIKSTVAGLEWGGDWDDFVDLPHYQVSVNKTLKEIRKDFEAGKDFL